MTSASGTWPLKAPEPLGVSPFSSAVAKRTPGSASSRRRIAEAALAPMPGLAAIAPVPAGGMSVARVPEMLDFYGRDVMLLIGGNLLVEGDRLSEATAAFVATVHRHSQAPAGTHA